MIAHDVMHQSSSGVGAFYAAFGAGGLLAGLGIGQLIRARLASAFGLSVVLWAVPVVIIGLVAQPAVSWVCAVAAGSAGAVAIDATVLLTLPRDELPAELTPEPPVADVCVPGR